MAWSSDVSDTEMVHLIRSDPEHGFTLLLQRYGGRIQGYLRRRFVSLDDGDLHDVVTDAMLALADSFDADRGTLSAWLLLLAHQHAVRLLRGRTVGALLEGEPDRWAEATRQSDPLGQLETLERVREVERIVERLPALERAVLESDMAEGKTANARVLAERLRTTEGSIYAARKRARTKLISRCSWVRQWLSDGEADT